MTQFFNDLAAQVPDYQPGAFNACFPIANRGGRPSKDGSPTAVLHVVPGPQHITSMDEEIEIHIEDAHWLYRTAYERFQMHGSPHDRDEAMLHLHRMNEAILARSPAVQARRHQEFEQQLTEQVAFFNSEAAVAMAGAS